jgi:peptidoglycan/xylan/chitin deacetylase (PgdA/CDA1 family)/quercetin dioxygenase-like cupin family protein
VNGRASRTHERGDVDVTPERDLTGYGPTPPTKKWLGPNRVAISLVVNYEEGSERSVPAGDESQETLTEWGSYPFPASIRNLAMESMYEYGSRVGVWRILDVFQRQSVRSTFFACAQAFEMNPQVARAAVAGGHEVCSHGWRWEEVYGLSEEEERDHIRLAVESFRRTTGKRPVGWYCRYGPSVHTRRLLVEEGGFLYDSDSYADDVPYQVQVDGRPHLVIPYAPDTNDIQFWLADPLATSGQFYDYLKDSLDTLYRESGTSPKIMSVGLHCRIIGRPGRIAGLERFIEYAKGLDGVWFATREEIARSWFAAQEQPSPASASDEGGGDPLTLVRLEDTAQNVLEGGAWSRLFIDRERILEARSTLGLSHFPAGAVTDPIRHESEEVCLVTKGAGEMRTDLGNVEFSQGDALHIPAGRWHSIANTGTGDVEMVFSFPTGSYPNTEKRVL